MTVRVLQGHVLEVLAALPAQSVHCVVTSPPYWSLRAYGTPPQVWWETADERCAQGHAWGPAILDHKRGQDAGPSAQVGNTVKRVCPPTTQQGAFCTRCGAWRGELGSEPTLSLFVSNLVTVFEAVKRVMRDDATLWVNLGDSYAGSNASQGGDGASSGLKRDGRPEAGRLSGNLAWQERAVSRDTPTKIDPSLPAGNLCMAPARFALAMQAAGWRLRSEKTDGLVQRWGSGRPTSAVEKLFLFAKGTGAYFYDLEGVRVPGSPTSHGGNPMWSRGPKYEGLQEGGQAPGLGQPAAGGRNLWNYVMWAPEPLAQAHYAAYPRWLPRLAIQAGTSEAGVCPDCGAPWLRIVDKRYVKSPVHGEGSVVGRHYETGSNGWDGAGYPRVNAETTTLGWRQSCRCPAHEPLPSTVLDPFAGSGTTLLEANALGRHGLGIELQERYVAITHQRLAGAPLSLFAWEGQETLGTGDAGAVEEAAG